MIGVNRSKEFSANLSKKNFYDIDRVSAIFIGKIVYKTFTCGIVLFRIRKGLTEQSIVRYT